LLDDGRGGRGSAVETPTEWLTKILCR